MSFFGNFGQTSYDGGAGPFLKHSHACTTWHGVNYAAIAHNEAKTANEAYLNIQNVIETTKSKLDKLNQLEPSMTSGFLSKSNKLEQRAEDLKHDVLAQEPQQSFNCPDPGWYLNYAEMLMNILSDAKSQLSKVEEALSAAKAAEAEAKAKPETQDDKKKKESKKESEVEKRLRLLKQQIEAKRKEEEERIRRIQEKHRKQAAYGRDIVQARPKAAGYATESEKIMGGRTGYYGKPKTTGGLGDASVQVVSRAAADLRKATDLVKDLSKAVEMGTATRSELEDAIVDLRIKAARVKSMSKSLEGYGGKSMNLFIILAVVGLAFLLLRPA